MVTRLSQLADLIQEDSLPAWLKSEIKDKQAEILEGLKTQGFFKLFGPDGEEITLEAEQEKPEKAGAAA